MFQFLNYLWEYNGDSQQIQIITKKELAHATPSTISTLKQVFPDEDSDEQRVHKALYLVSC